MILAVIASVAWLQGCWQMTSGDRVVDEQWMAPRAGVMLGIGRTVRGEQLVEYEWVMLSEKTGSLAYEAHPSGQQSAVFTAQSASGTEVVFENPQHDFPQRVGYRRDGDTMLAWVEGTVGGNARRVEFPYRRVACQ
jgi:hypothetical protein